MKDKSFEEVYLQFKPLIKGQISALNIYKDHDNFYQIGMIALWKAYKAYDEKKGLFASYAFQCVRGSMINELKKQRSFAHSHSLQRDNEINITYEDQPFHEEMLVSYLKPLTKKQQKWVVYSMVEQLTPQEIAKKEGVSTEAVKSWRRQALKKLRHIKINER